MIDRSPVSQAHPVRSCGAQPSRLRTPAFSLPRLPAFILPKTINTIENGAFIPSTLLALKLAWVLNKPTRALFALEAPPTSGNQ